MALEYITTRILKEKVIGKIRIIKLKEEVEGNVEYTCPNCGYGEKKKIEWKEPFVQGKGISQTFNLNCNKCNFLIKITKLKKEIKKKK